MALITFIFAIAAPDDAAVLAIGMSDFRAIEVAALSANNFAGK